MPSSSRMRPFHLHTGCAALLGYYQVSSRQDWNPPCPTRSILLCVFFYLAITERWLLMFKALSHRPDELISSPVFFVLNCCLDGSRYNNKIKKQPLSFIFCSLFPPSISNRRWFEKMRLFDEVVLF